MSWSKHGDKGPRGYHHGNLKEALIRAALALIAEKGPGGFTFAEAARWAGVSPAAPYRHFRDRDELLADVARRGFELFEAALAKSWNDGRPDPLAAFDRLGKASGTKVPDLLDSLDVDFERAVQLFAGEEKSWRHEGLALAVLREIAEDAERRLEDISEAITRAYFSHVPAAQAVGSMPPTVAAG